MTSQYPSVWYDNIILLLVMCVWNRAPTMTAYDDINGNRDT